MENSNSNLSIGYNTQFLGVPKNIKECTTIILYNREVTGLEEITLFNINTIYSKLIGDKTGSGGLEHVTLHRNTVEETDYFEYNPAINVGLSKGFDVILYLNQMKNAAVGFTTFSSIQAEMSSNVRYTVRIFLTFTSEDISEIEVNIVNSLSEASSSSSSSSSDSKELWKYITIEQIKDSIDIKDSTPKYTNSIEVIKKNYDKKITLDSGTMLSQGKNEFTFYQYGIKDSIKIDPYRVGLNNLEIGAYMGDLLVYKWSGLKYAVSSLLKENVFQNAKEYFKHGGPGYDDIVLPKDLVGREKSLNIEYFASQFCIIRDIESNDTYLYDLERASFIETDGMDFIVDTWSNDGKIIYYPKNSSLSRVKTYIPRITDMYLPTTESGIRLIRKKGDWYIMKKTTIGDSFIIYSCPSGTIWTVEGKDKVTLLNNKCLLIHTVETNYETTDSEGNTEKNNYDYYSLFYADQGINDRVYKTENALNLESGDKFDSSKMIRDNEFGIIMFNSKSNLRNYREGRISIIQTERGLTNLVMCGLRRKPMREDKNIPNVATAYGGILFYLDKNNNLQYL